MDNQVPIVLETIGRVIQDQGIIDEETVKNGLQYPPMANIEDLLLESAFKNSQIGKKRICQQNIPETQKIQEFMKEKIVGSNM